MVYPSRHHSLPPAAFLPAALPLSRSGCEAVYHIVLSYSLKRLLIYAQNRSIGLGQPNCRRCLMRPSLDPEVIPEP